MEVIIQPDPDDDQNLKKYMLAVGEGSARDIEDPVAAFDYKSIKQCMYLRRRGDGLLGAVPKYEYDPNLYQYT